MQQLRLAFDHGAADWTVHPLPAQEPKDVAFAPPEFRGKRCGEGVFRIRLVAWYSCGNHVTNESNSRYTCKGKMKHSLHAPSTTLKALMADRGITPAYLARETGLSHVAIGNYVKGRMPNTKSAQAIASYFGISIEELLKTPTHLNLGDKTTAIPSRPRTIVGAVASRLPASNQRVPIRADCEALFQKILDAAGNSGDPSAFPVIMHRLKKQFPLKEFEVPQE